MGVHNGHEDCADDGADTSTPASSTGISAGVSAGISAGISAGNSEHHAPFQGLGVAERVESWAQRAPSGHIGPGPPTLSGR